MKALSKLVAVCVLVGLGGVGGYVLHDRVPSFQIREVNSAPDDESGCVVFEHASSESQLLQEIAARLDRLEQRLPLNEAVDPTADAAQIAATMARLDELDVRVAEVEENDSGTVTVFARSPLAITRESVQEWQDTIVRPNSDEARLQALRGLRSTPSQLTPHAPIAPALIAWLDNSKDAEVRADIIRQLHGADVPSLADPLIHYLLHDPSESVREEAAETLSDYYTLPEVQQALRRAEQSDESRGVRREAAQSLHGGERKGRDDDGDDER
ncbi:MAG: HEAT repeat domain-containing protein [Planctomycetota bacterium]